MTHALKFYEHNNLTCDMRNTRNTFFPVMLGDKKLVDIEKGSDTELTYNFPSEGLEFTFNTLNGLDEETYNDVFELLSQITKDNDIKNISFHSTDEFPKYRRKKDENGHFEFADERAKKSGKDDFVKHVSGKFMVVVHDNKNYIIDKHTYKKLLENNCEISLPKNNVFPRLLVGGEHIKCAGSLYQMCFVENGKTLENVTFENNSPDSHNLALYFNVNKLDKNEKIVLPKIISTNKKDVFLDIHFIDNKNGNFIDINKDMFDFKNIPERNKVQVSNSVTLSFDVPKPELKNDNTFTPL